MANELDEVRGPKNDAGRDINVIDKQIEIKVGVGSLIFEIMLWVLAIIPGIIFLIMKIKAKNYLARLQQSIQSAASEIDNGLEQRVQILQNTVGLLEKSIDLDKDVMKSVAAYRAGTNPDSVKADQERNIVSDQMDQIYKKVNVAFEQYPDLKAQATIADAMQQNDYLQREITARRGNYNDFVLRWNQEIQVWPTKKIVAARAGYTTRIPFTASSETKQKATGTFF